MVLNSVDPIHVIVVLVITLVVAAWVVGPSADSPGATLEGPASVEQSDRVTLTATVPVGERSPDAFVTDRLTIRSTASGDVDVAFDRDGSVASVTRRQSGSTGSTDLDLLREETTVRVVVEDGGGPYDQGGGPVRLIITVGVPASGLPPGEYVAELRIAVDGGRDIVLETRFVVTAPTDAVRATGGTVGPSPDERASTPGAVETRSAAVHGEVTDGG